MLFLTEPLKGNGGGKNRGELKTFGVGEKNICYFLKTFAFLQETLHYLTKLLQSLAKPAEFEQTLPVYFTACSGS